MATAQAASTGGGPLPLRQDTVQVYTIYLIRHGEAAHNVLEKKARKLAKEAAIAEGYAADSDEALRRMEEARRSVLDDITLLDSPLTKQGMKEAHGARKLVENLQAKGLPEPTEVLVSPLQRALQTANLVFPRCDNIHVRVELQERQTGKPCDMRQSAECIGCRKSFMRFSMQRLRLAECDAQEFVDSLILGGSSECTDDDEDDDDDDSVDSSNNKQTENRASLSKSVVEEKEMLRDRTKKVFGLLAETEHRVICVITHKGYLRELERGHLGQPDATEFQNCEVRVYRVSINLAAATTMPCDVQRLELASS